LQQKLVVKVAWLLQFKERIESEREDRQVWIKPGETEKSPWTETSECEFYSEKDEGEKM
jgi:hypothetical protein